jgi:predicted nucleotidyltransferase
MTLTNMWEGLTRADVRFVVIGGIAGVAHGSTRRTDDLDICYDPSTSNVQRLVGLLNAWHAHLRLPHEDGAKLPFVIDGRTFRDTPILTLQTNLGNLDLLDRVAGVGDYEAVAANSQLVNVGPIELRVLTLEALIAAKRATGRPRDQEHLIELRALQALKQQEAKAPPARRRPPRSR